jgi:hypothetical protein
VQLFTSIKWKRDNIKETRIIPDNLDAMSVPYQQRPGSSSGWLSQQPPAKQRHQENEHSQRDGNYTKNYSSYAQNSMHKDKDGLFFRHQRDQYTKQAIRVHIGH